jgi:hypothetical protein
MPAQLVSPGTAVTILVGLVIGFFYLRFMWAALQKAVRTRDEPDGGKDQYHFSFAGAVLSVVASSAAIAAFGAGPALLYLGPLLALGSAVAVATCLRREVTGK